VTRLGRLALALALALGCGCAGPDAACPVAPVPVAELADSLPLRAQLRFLDDENASGVEAVAVLESDELVVVGLAPFGARLFSIRQEGAVPRVEPTSWARAGPRPLWVLDVLHRVFWIQPPPGTEAEAGDGESTAWQRGVEQVVETRRGAGRRRRFSRGPDYAEDVVIEYPDASQRGRGQPVTIHNPWCGYSARVVREAQ
jgi:hypothetical protein